MFVPSTLIINERGMQDILHEVSRPAFCFNSRLCLRNLQSALLGLEAGAAACAASAMREHHPPVGVATSCRLHEYWQANWLSDNDFATKSVPASKAD